MRTGEKQRMPLLGVGYRWAIEQVSVARDRGYERMGEFAISRVPQEQIGRTTGRDICLSLDDGPIIGMSDDQLHDMLLAVGCPWVRDRSV